MVKIAKFGITVPSWALGSINETLAEPGYVKHGTVELYQDWIAGRVRVKNPETNLYQTYIEWLDGIAGQSLIEIPAGYEPIFEQAIILQPPEQPLTVEYLAESGLQGEIVILPTGEAVSTFERIGPEIATIFTPPTSAIDAGITSLTGLGLPLLLIVGLFLVGGKSG